MGYDTIAGYFLVPTGAEPPAPVVADTPARRLRDSIEAIATIGWWSREASAAVTSLGHGFFDGYAWGRAAALGADANPSVVVSAFGVFAASLIVPVYEQARAVSTREAVLAARADGAAEGLRAATAGVDPALVADMADRLLAAVAELEPGPRALFGALQSLPVPDSVEGRLWRAAELVREHRGDGHLAACVAAGLDMAEMNVLTEVWLGYGVGEYSATRGFAPGQLGAACDRLTSRGWMDADRSLTPAGRAARDAIETATDASQAALVDALGADLDPVVDAGHKLTAAILAHHAAPADPRKRAAG